jgi:hypothetical protein
MEGREKYLERERDGGWRMCVIERERCMRDRWRET